MTNRGMTRLIQAFRARTLMLPRTTEEVGKAAFTRVPGLLAVVANEGLETLGACAFARCRLRDLWLPSTLENIEPCAFLRHEITPSTSQETAR